MTANSSRIRHDSHTGHSGEACDDDQTEADSLITTEDPRQKRRAKEQHAGLMPQAPRPRPEFVNMNNVCSEAGPI